MQEHKFHSRPQSHCFHYPTEELTAVNICWEVSSVKRKEARFLAAFEVRDVSGCE